MPLAARALNQGRVSVPPDTATLLRKFGLDPDKQGFFFVYNGKNVTLEEFCKENLDTQTEILTKGRIFTAYA